MKSTCIVVLNESNDEDFFNFDSKRDIFILIKSIENPNLSKEKIEKLNREERNICNNKIVEIINSYDNKNYPYGSDSPITKLERETYLDNLLFKEYAFSKIHRVSCKNTT